MLAFGDQAPFSFGGLLERCKGLIPRRDFEILASVPDSKAGLSHLTLEKWQAFDRALKNALVIVRAGYKKIEAGKYLRGDEYIDPAIARIALSAHRNPSPLEGERMLDRLRWQVLDDLSAGHYFDLDCLICYVQKLIILERWQRINSADKAQAVESVLKE